MDQLVILSSAEQEYLLRIIEGSVQLRDVSQLFLWSQGPLQALLPHQLMVCMQFSADGALRRIECFQEAVMDAGATARLSDAGSALAVRLARHCCSAGAFACSAQVGAVLATVLLPFKDELAECGYENLLLHGTGPVAGCNSVCALFGMPMKPGPRQAWFLSLLLPHLHLALARLAASTPARRGEGAQSPLPRPLSAREKEIVSWLREGKRNDEIGALLGISSLTVKNHLQRIYKLLGVRNRGEAVARCAAP